MTKVCVKLTKPSPQIRITHPKIVCGQEDYFTSWNKKEKDPEARVYNFFKRSLAPVLSSTDTRHACDIQTDIHRDKTST